MEKASTTGNTNPGKAGVFEMDTIPTGAANVAKGLQGYLYTGNLSDKVKIADHNDDLITVRDYIRLTFAELGIEVEFSGKNEFEKGVIIDMDEARVAELGLNPDALRFGQTVVKVYLAYYNQ